MHASSIARMEKFAELCANIYKDKQNICILDVGGVGKSYRDIFNKYLCNSTYHTMNIKSGMKDHIQDCDIVVEKAYDWKEIGDNSYDIVISGQTFEHIEYPWLTILEIRRVLNTGGWVCIIAPSHWPEHKAPLDTYRYYLDGMNALARYAGLEIIYSGADHPSGKVYESLQGDCYIVCQKSESPYESHMYESALAAQLEILPPAEAINISQSCSFTQSSHAFEALRGIGRGYNVLSGNFSGEYAIHTCSEEDPWILITLPSNRYVTKLLIFNRKGFEFRSEKIMVYSSTNMLDWTLVLHNPGYFGGIYDACPLRVVVEKHARYFQIRNSEKNCLHFDQIQVFAL